LSKKGGTAARRVFFAEPSVITYRGGREREGAEIDLQK